MKYVFFSIWGLLIWAVSVATHATPPASTAFTPTWQQRHQLQRLVDQAGLALPMTHWPLPVAVVEQALRQMPVSTWGERQPEWLETQQNLLQDLKKHIEGQSRVQVRNRAEGAVGFDENYTPGSSVQVLSPEGTGQTSGGLDYAYRLGVKLEQSANSLQHSGSVWGTDGQNQARLDGTSLVAGMGDWNLQAFSQKFWWGPGWQNSLILSHNAPAWNGVGLQRNSVAASTSPWFRWAGPWHFDLFVAQAQDPWVTANQPRGHLMSAFRLTLQPQPWLELGFARAMQFGGTGRAGGVGNFTRALFFQNSHTYDTQDTRGDASNSVAGFDVRARCPKRWGSCAFYTQWMGEDTTAVYGNKIQQPWKYTTLWGYEQTLGSGGRHRVFAEYANMYQDSSPLETYRGTPGGIGSFYPQGETNGARWMSSSFGGGSEVTTLGWMDAQSERMVKVHWGRTLYSAGAYVPNLNAPRGELRGMSLRQTWQWQGYRVSPELSVLHLKDGVDQWSNRRNNLRMGVEISRRF